MDFSGTNPENEIAAFLLASDKQVAGPSPARAGKVLGLLQEGIQLPHGLRDMLLAGCCFLQLRYPDLPAI